MNWSFVILLLALLAVKLIGTTLFLQYFSQIFSTTVPLQEVPSSSSGARECETGWKLFEGSCYYFSSLEYTWENSRKDCKQSGADLAVIKNDAKLRFLKDRTHNLNYFIGLRQSPKGTWKWIDGTNLDQNIINNLDRDNDCGVVGILGTGSVFCSVPNRWICEMIPANR